ncbi:TetR/AcrR family transcriptional regulator [Nocardioides sp. GXQ0305]|uniref:TetR/AcrR family transcriptional regulator n=1 Tax=Nocardioides sp. GXQ0305 TaxID=3423912 RepID=UPI003D7D30A8
MGRREELLDRVTDHVLSDGLIGLTLRPLAAAVGTSDRMLLYHFGSRDALVSAVVAESTARAARVVGALPPAASVRDAVNRLWETYRQEPLRSCLTLYVQAAASGLIGEEPYRSDARTSNQQWAAVLGDHLVASGAPAERVGRLVTLVDSALYGFHLTLITDRPEELAQGVDDLAVAAEALATS